ncbi:MAG: leucine-rich repeat domain-containing protein [Clostridia bacterium]|nr:leucine-rich repeat domain-containing protein [Clostridia bacterium]
MKVKNLIIIFSIIVMLVLLPNIVNAANEITSTEKTATSTGANVQWTYTLNESDQIENLKCKNLSDISGELTIPEKIDNHTVIKIGSSAFKDCKGLTGISFPNTIKEIGNYAFSGCVGIKSLEIPSSVVTIGIEAFKNCSGLKNIKLNSGLVSINRYSFYGCSGISEITIPDSVTFIGSYAFYSCSGLKNVKLSENLTKISAETFSRCSGLTSIVIPENVTTIEDCAFYECTNLNKIKIGENISSIGVNVFSYDKKLTIYGKKDSVAENYAKTNNIPFDLIENWNKAEQGNDITAPTVTSIRVVEPTSGTYTTNKSISIRVYFSENVTGETVPTLKIKFGTGSEKSITKATIKDNYVEYTYKIESNDNGQLAVSSLSGGTIKDASGNNAVITCPLISGNSIIANNAVASSEGQKSNENNSAANSSNDSQKDNSANNSSNGNSANNVNDSSNANNNNANNTADETISKIKLPNTGKAGIGMIALLIIIATSVSYSKYKKLKGI